MTINYSKYLLGFNLILISRTAEKLEQVSKEIQNISPSIQVNIIVINFTSKHILR